MRRSRSHFVIQRPAWPRCLHVLDIHGTIRRRGGGRGMKKHAALSHVERLAW